MQQVSSDDWRRAALTELAHRGDALVLCEAAPASAAAAMAPPEGGGVALGAVGLAGGVGAGDFSINDDDPMMLEIAAQDAMTVGAPGSGAVLALVSTAKSQVLATAALPGPMQVTPGDPIATPALQVGIAAEASVTETSVSGVRGTP